jgi:hypothetical protein
VTKGRILDCGHTPSPHSETSTGTAHVNNDCPCCAIEICWTCSHKRELHDLSRADRYTAYLVSKPTGAVLTDWPGGVLARVTEVWTRPVGYSRDGRTYFNAIDATGARWHGTSPGYGMSATMRRSKGDN